MSRIPFLGVIAIGATLLIAPTANAMPLGAAHTGRSVSTADAPRHAPKPRCARNGISTNKAGHLNCRKAKTTTTGDAAAPATSSTGDTNPSGTAPSTSDQGDQNDQGSSGSDAGSSGSDQGDQNDQGDQGSSGSQSGGRSDGSGDHGNQHNDN